MRARLKNVVAWVPRIYPPRRIIPAHLKLAILSRGRIALPAAKVGWFLDEARQRKSTLPDRLTVSLEQIAPEYPVTVELFLNQRIHMNGAEIDEALKGYLGERRRKHLGRQCLFLLYAFMTAGSRRVLEDALALDISLLFTKAKVVITRRTKPNQYILVAYVCLPLKTADYLKPEPKPEPKPVVIPPLPQDEPDLGPLFGLTNVNARVHLRIEPSTDSESLGVLAGTAGRVTVLAKWKTEERIVFIKGRYARLEKARVWYQIQLNEPLLVTKTPSDPLSAATVLEKDTVAWIADIGMDYLQASWARFRNDVSRFEAAHSRLDLLDRITLLRQMTHEKRVPIDVAIGTKKGSMYRDTIPFAADRWQLSKDYLVVAAPDGQRVEVQHVITGMDALWRRHTTAYFSMKPIGSTWSAPTWAGDVGSAAGDATIRTYSDSWERWHPKGTDIERADFYYDCQAPEHELYGDIDGWGIVNLMRTKREADSIDSLLALYYTDIKTDADTGLSLTVKRADSLKGFLGHYGLEYRVSTDYAKWPVLKTQREPVRTMKAEVFQFAAAWMLKDVDVRWSSDPEERKPHYVDYVVDKFLYWLEQRCVEHGIDTDA